MRGLVGVRAGLGCRAGDLSSDSAHLEGSSLAPLSVSLPMKWRLGPRLCGVPPVKFRESRLFRGSLHKIKVLCSTIPFLSTKSLTPGARLPAAWWGWRGEVALWISAESCLVGEGHRKGAVLMALPSCRLASWHLEMMAAQPSWRTQAVISRTFYDQMAPSISSLGGSPQLKTVASSLASMLPGHLSVLSRGQLSACPFPAQKPSVAFSCSCEFESDSLFETLYDLAPGQRLSSSASSLLSL